MEVLFKKFKLIEIKTKKYGEYIFSDNVNIISAKNTVGKSTLIKSIMYSLGFEIIKWSKKFKIEDFIYNMTLTIDNELYEILRYKDHWIINNEYYSSDDYKKFLKKILKIDIDLILKSSDKSTLYPTDIFLYYYVDQDSSYNKKLFENNHKKLQMYNRDEIKKLLRYFLGLYDKNLASLKSKLTKVSNQKNKYDQRKELVSKFLEEFSDVKIQTNALTAENYQREKENLEKLINEYVNKRKELEKEKYKHQTNWLKLDKERITYENIYETLTNSTSEICLHCGNLINKNFIDQLKIEDEKITILNSYGKLREQMKEVSKKIDKTNEKLLFLEKELKTKEKEYYSVKENFDFNEIIKNNINYEVKKRFEEELDKLDTNIDFLKNQISTLKNQIKEKAKSIEEKEKDIKLLYDKLIQESLINFGLNKNNSIDNEFLDFNVQDTGVSSNIIYIILYYVYFHILSQKSFLKLPILWDAFIKEAFDEKNLPALNKFVNEEILEKINNQIIVSNVIGEKSGDAKINKKTSYNFIILKEKLCNKDNTELENTLLDTFIQAMEKIKTY